MTDLNLSGCLGQTFSAHGVATVLHEDTSAKAAARRAGSPRTRPVSIMGIAGAAVVSAAPGLAALLALLIAINIVFGILNMLPMIRSTAGT